MKKILPVLCVTGLFVSPALAGNVPDSWSTGAPPDPQWEETSQAVLSQNLAVIADDMQASAQTLLRKKSIVALTPAQAAKYMGPSVPAAAPAATAPSATPDAAAAPAMPADATSPATDAASAPAAGTPPDTTNAADAQTAAAPADAQAATPAAPAPAAAPPATPALKAYLVRGVLLQDAIGGFTAERKGDALWISYDGLAATAPKPLHRALVVRLPSAPAHIYVTASFTN